MSADFLMSVADLVTPRLLLTQCEEAELGELHKLWNEPVIGRYLWKGQLISLDQAAQILQESLLLRKKIGVGLWLIRLWPDCHVIGFCGFGPDDNMEDTLLVYGLRPEEQRKGFALEATRAVLAYAFANEAFSRIYAHADTENQRSRTLLLRLGMRFEKEICAGERSVMRYVLLREDFQAV